MNAVTKDFADAVEKQFGKLDADVKQALEKAKTVENILMDIEQKMARKPGAGGGRIESWGQQVVDSDQVKMLADVKDTQPGRVRIEVRDITSAAASGGALTPPGRDTTVNRIAGRRALVRDLLTTINTSSGTVEYVDQTSRDNQAAPQVEGALKAESSYAFELKSTPIRTIAHWTKASVQVLDDAPQLMSIIDEELLYGLEIAEEDQLLFGGGTGATLDGLVTNATAYADLLSLAGPTMIDTVGTAMLQVSLVHYVPNGVIVNPADWMRMRLLKDADGKYLLGDPQSDAPLVLFGLPVVPTPAMTIDKFLVGDFRAAATLYDRQAASVQLSTEGGDNFVRYMVTIRAEERIGLALKNATALSYGDFGNVA